MWIGLIFSSTKQPNEVEKRINQLYNITITSKNQNNFPILASAEYQQRRDGNTQQQIMINIKYVYPHSLIELIIRIILST
jgi:hypothetical protein